MADTLKVYTLICPDIDCAEEFDIALSPEALAEGGDPIECPGCQEEWEWEYDPDLDALQLLGDEDEADETDLIEGPKANDEDDDE